MYSHAFQHMEEERHFRLTALSEHLHSTHTHTHTLVQYNRVISAVTYTGSKVPRLPLEKLCCSRIVCKETKTRIRQCFIPVGRHKQIQASVYLQCGRLYGMCNNCEMRESEDESTDSGDGKDTERHSERDP